MIQSAANMDFTSFLVVILVMVFCAVAVSKLTDLLAEDLSPPKWSGPNYPILGHLPAMIPYSKAFKAHAFFYRVLQESGPVVTVNMFTRKVVVTSNADAAKQILTNGDYFCIRPTFLQEKFEGIAKNALFVLPSGEIWRKHRKLLQPAFGPAHLRHAFDATMSFSRVLFDKVWNQHVESDTPFNVHRHMSCLTADVIGQVAFSYEFQLVPNLLTPDSERMKAIHHLDNLLVIVVRKFMPDWIKFLFGVKLPKDEGSLEKLKEMFKSVIDEKISKAKKENSGGSEQDKNKDVLDRLMVHDDSAPEKSFSQEELMDEMFAFFLAGHETTANTITFALLELCRNPDCFKKLREEADSILSSPSTEDNQSSSTTPNALSYERVGEFKYAEAVIKEALRLHPVVSGIPRQTAKDVLLGGFVVRKGTQVSISIRALHHSRDYWTDPLEYQPSRWLKEGFAPVPGSYLPFGDGPMNCIGQKMAMMEARLLVAFIARNYDLEPIPGQDLDPITTITTGLKNGLMMKAKKRKIFAVLTPYRPLFVSLTVILVSYNILQNGFNWKTMQVALISLLITTSVDVVEMHNQGGHLRLGFSSSVVPPPITTNNLHSACSLVEYGFSIQGLKCEGCAERLKSKLESELAAVKDVRVFFNQKRLQVTMEKCKQSSISDSSRGNENNGVGTESRKQEDEADEGTIAGDVRRIKEIVSQLDLTYQVSYLLSVLHLFITLHGYVPPSIDLDITQDMSSAWSDILSHSPSQIHSIQTSLKCCGFWQVKDRPLYNAITTPAACELLPSCGVLILGLLDRKWLLLKWGMYSLRVLQCAILISYYIFSGQQKPQQSRSSSSQDDEGNLYIVISSNPLLSLLSSAPLHRAWSPVSLFQQWTASLHVYAPRLLDEESNHWRRVPIRRHYRSSSPSSNYSYYEQEQEEDDDDNFIQGLDKSFAYIEPLPLYKQLDNKEEDADMNSTQLLPGYSIVVSIPPDYDYAVHKAL